MIRTLILLAFALPACAEVPIDPANRVANTDHYSCGWCALETLAREQGVSSLYGLRDARQAHWASISTPDAVQAQLDYLGVAFTMRRPGVRDTAFLADTLASNRGVAVGLGGPNMGHVVVLVELTESTARVVDSSDPATVRTITRERFDQAWDGWAVRLDRVTVK